MKKMMHKTDVLFELEIGADAISRSYAIEQMNMAIAESNDADERLQFARFIEFLKVLPAYSMTYRRINE